MVNKNEGQWVVPNPQVPRTFGTMNIVFGGLLLLLGAGYIASWIFMPYFTKPLMARAAAQQAEQKAQRETKIADLKRQEDAAKTKEEKEALQSEREVLEKHYEPDISEFTEFSSGFIFSDIRLTIYYFAEVGVGILLNLLMLISGVGLLGLSDWARRLAVGVAWAKIARWVAMAILTMVLVLPITMPKVQKAFDKMTQAKAGQVSAGPGPMLNLAQVGAISGAITMVFSALVASIYPGLSIWYLTRPQTRAACLARLPLIVPVPGDGPGEST